MADQLLIEPGPGHIDWPKTTAYGVSADVGLELIYLNLGPESGTRAILHLAATKIEEPHADVSVGMELTAADLVLIRGTIDVLLIAIKEDDA